MATTLSIKNTVAKKQEPAVSSQRAAGNQMAASSSPEFDALFQQHWERVCLTLYRLVGDWDEAEDLALETFLRLHRQPLAASNPGGWLYRAATRLGLNALRARKRRLHYETQAGALDLAVDQPPNPAESAERIQERQWVRTALSQMKPRSAQLLILRYSGLSYNELATTLNVAPGSVGTLLARAEREFEKKYRRLAG